MLPSLVSCRFDDCGLLGGAAQLGPLGERPAGELAPPPRSVPAGCRLRGPDAAGCVRRLLAAPALGGEGRRDSGVAEAPGQLVRVGPGGLARAGALPRTRPVTSLLASRLCA